jgi:hypothetical protein
MDSLRREVISLAMGRRRRQADRDRESREWAEVVWSARVLMGVTHGCRRAYVGLTRLLLSRDDRAR